MISLILAIGLTAVLRLVATASGNQARSENYERVQNALDTVYVESVAKARAGSLALGQTSNVTTTDGVVVSLTTVDLSSTLSRLIRLDLSATYGSEVTKRTEYIGSVQPGGLPTGQSGLNVTAYQTNGTNSYWGWPPVILTPRPHLQRVMTQFAYSGPSLSFVPDMPAPFLTWRGTITPTTTGSYRFDAGGDDKGFLEVDGQIVFSNFDNIQGLPSVSTQSINLIAGKTYRMTWIFLDIGGGGSFNLRFWINWGQETQIPASWTKPYGRQDGSKNTWVFTLQPKQTFSRTIIANDQMENATPIDLWSLGFVAGDRITIGVYGLYSAYGGDPGRTHSTACFSTTAELLSDTNSSSRIPGAIQGVNPTKSGAPETPTQAFWISWAVGDQTVQVTIPVNGRYLFVGVHDPVGHVDNSAIPGIGFGYYVEKAN
jgi:hypothetical protein